MHFINAERGLSDEEIRQVEETLDLAFPEGLKRLFKVANGGEPQPYVFYNEALPLHTVVSETLPLVSTGRPTAQDAYQRIVVETGLAPREYFPFAVDAGGDYFLINCDGTHPQVHFLTAEALKATGLTIEEFWASLVDEED